MNRNFSLTVDMHVQLFYFYTYNLSVMNTKLTLSLDQEIIQKAKEYAQKKNVSLSFIVENYLLKITSDYDDLIAESSIVNELSGIINLDEDFDYRQAHAEYLTEKYR